MNQNTLFRDQVGTGSGPSPLSRALPAAHWTGADLARSLECLMVETVCEFDALIGAHAGEGAQWATSLDRCEDRRGQDARDDRSARVGQRHRGLQPASR